MKEEVIGINKVLNDKEYYLTTIRGNYLIELGNKNCYIYLSKNMILVNKDNGLYINNELKIVGTNIAAQSGKIGTLFGSEGMEMTWSEMKAVTKDGDETSFNDEITKVQSDIDTYKSNLAL